jgi:hypothetical protein
MLFEEFIARESRPGTLKLKLKALPQSTALLHGHCHQKAFDAVRRCRLVLGFLIPGCGMKVELIESSCCGMARQLRGGYEAEALRRVDADGRAVAAAGGARYHRSRHCR